MDIVIIITKEIISLFTYDNEILRAFPINGETEMEIDIDDEAYFFEEICRKILGILNIDDFSENGIHIGYTEECVDYAEMLLELTAPRAFLQSVRIKECTDHAMWAERIVTIGGRDDMPSKRQLEDCEAEIITLREDKAKLQNQLEISTKECSELKKQISELMEKHKAAEEKLEQTDASLNYALKFARRRVLRLKDLDYEYDNYANTDWAQNKSTCYVSLKNKNDTNYVIKHNKSNISCSSINWVRDNGNLIGRLVDGRISGIVRESSQFSFHPCHECIIYFDKESLSFSCGKNVKVYPLKKEDIKGSDEFAILTDEYDTEEAAMAWYRLLKEKADNATLNTGVNAVTQK